MKSSPNMGGNEIDYSSPPKQLPTEERRHSDGIENPKKRAAE